MIETLTMRRYVRFFLAGSALFAGFAVALLLIHVKDFASAVAIYSISLAALVGTGKRASP